MTSNDLEVLALIAARAGSKGVDNKNLLVLAGKPSLAYSIEDARRARIVTRIVVSTESPDSARVARECGAEAIDRPQEYASDTARLDYVIRHALDVLKEQEDYVPDVIVLLYGNVPLREEGIIDRCVEHLVETGASSVRTFSWTGKYHPQWMNRIVGDHIENYEPLRSFRRQDLEPLYIHDGACAAITYQTMIDSVNHLEDNFCLFGDDPRGIICKDGATVEIDTPWDVYIAGAALRHRREKAERNEDR